MKAKEKGTLRGVGVGPGDPGLLTLRALEILRATPVIFAASSPKTGVSRALAVAAPLLPPPPVWRSSPSP